VPTEKLLALIMSFLKCEKSQAWIDEAVKKENLSVLLIDHFVCELNVNMCK
jgi:tRNA-(ms[2]io[6]A)-hydroxylase